MTKPRKHGSDKNHAKRSTRIQKRHNQELRPIAVSEGMSYTTGEDRAILDHYFTDRKMASMMSRSLYAIRARRKRLKQTMNLSDTRDVRRQAETLVVNP